VQRLERFITKRVKSKDYIMVGHSMGTLLTRAVLPQLSHKPVACFLLAPPATVCKAARHFAPYPFFKLLGGEMAQLLANPRFMGSIPPASVPMKIYAGTAGPRGRYSPFGNEPNDGLLTVKETMVPKVPIQTVRVLHTFIMNSKVITRDIVTISKSQAQAESFHS
jgi:hypothetical protein